MIKFEMLKSEILEVNRTGEIRVEDIVNHVRKIDTAHPCLKQMFILDRIGESHTFFENINQLSEITSEIESRISRFQFVRHALLVNQPFETAIIYFFQQLANKIKNYHLCVFCTEKAALNWLGL